MVMVRIAEGIAAVGAAIFIIVNLVALVQKIYALSKQGILKK